MHIRSNGQSRHRRTRRRCSRHGVRSGRPGCRRFAGNMMATAGTIFDQVIEEGVHLNRGNEGNWGSQAVDFPGRGALGLFQAGDGEP